MDYVQNHSAVKAIITLQSMWFMGSTSFGVTWRVQQLQVVSRPQRLVGFSFVGDDDTAMLDDE